MEKKLLIGVGVLVAALLGVISFVVITAGKKIIAYQRKDIN